jgi:hypothetical protein
LLPGGHGDQLVVAPDGNEIAVVRSSWEFMNCVCPLDDEDVLGDGLDERSHVLVVRTATRPLPLPPSCVAQPGTCGTTNGFSRVGCPVAVRRNW